jgi:hypothetical protein
VHRLVEQTLDAGLHAARVHEGMLFIYSPSP